MAEYKTLAVKPDTYERFENYKFRSMTADDVLNFLMDHVPLEEAFRELSMPREPSERPERPHPPGRRRARDRDRDDE